MQGTSYQSITLVLAAGESRQVAAYGRYFRVLDNSITTQPQVRIGGESEQELQAGVGIELPIGDENSFIQVMVRNPALVQMTLKIAVASGKIDDSRLSLVGSSVFDNILAELTGAQAAQGYALVVVAAAATVIKALNASRKSITVTALPTNTGVIYLGFDNLVTASKYFVSLGPGDSWSADDYQGAVYGFAAVNGESVSYGEV